MTSQYFNIYRKKNSGFDSSLFKIEFLKKMICRF